MLPSSFLKANEFLVRGGVELGFMSTTTNREVALEYAGDNVTTGGFLLEIQQGMVDRGALLDWLSQYPHEQEIL